MTQNPLGPGKARLRPCEAPVRPWSGPVEKPPAQARKRPLWGRWGPVLGETAGLGKLAKPVGRKPPSLPFLAALTEGKRDAKLSSFWTESFWNESLFPDFSPGQAERPAVLPGTGFGGLAPLPPIILTNKVQKEKGDDTWQNQENEIRL